MGHPAMTERGHREIMMARNRPREATFLNTGAAVFNYAHSIPVAPENLAQAAKNIRAWQQAHPPAKVYTNQDIDRVHQQDLNRPQTAIPTEKQ